jgi:hypothetical protein
MSEENVEVVRRATDAFNRRDVDALLATASPDVEWEDAIFWSGVTRIYRGRAGLRDWFNQVLEPWESIRVEMDEIAEADDRVFFDLVINAAARAAAWRHPDFGSGASCGSLTARSRDGWCSVTGTKPSKPPGCRSRRFRRRT